MRILFLSAHIAGHLDWGGYLKTAAELTRRDHDTVWASGEEVRSLVEGADVAFHPLTVTGWRWPPPPPLTPDAAPDASSLRLLKQRRALDQWLDVDRVATATAEIVDFGRSFRPDLVVSEMFVAASGLVAEMLESPFVVAGWPAPAPVKDADVDSTETPMVTEARSRLATLLEQFGLTGLYWTKDGPPALLSPTLHLTYWSDSWYEGVATRAQTRHVGGLSPDSLIASDDNATPVDTTPQVLITLGTSFNRDLSFFIRAAAAVERQGCVPLVVFGQNLAESWIQATLPQLPDTAVAMETIDFATSLPTVTAAIHHGGAGTTHALVTHGIPQIVVPHAADQSFQARGVSRTGVGVQLPPRRATVASLEKALSALLYERSPFRQRAFALRAEFHGLGGVQFAADLIEQIAQPSQQHQYHRSPTEEIHCKP